MAQCYGQLVLVVFKRRVPLSGKIISLNIKKIFWKTLSYIMTVLASKSRKIRIDAVLPSNPQIPINNTSSLNDVLSSREKQSGIQSKSVCFICHISLVSFNLEKFFILPLSFMTLAFLKTTGNLFCRIFLNLSVV